MNIIKLESIDASQVPAHIAARQANNAVFAAGLPQGGGFPMIGLKGTRFVIKSDGSETVLPSDKLPVILVSAKQNLDRKYYTTKFDQNNPDGKSPDCFSNDGVRPDPSSALKQHTACAGCPQNEFGSARDGEGGYGKGKACQEAKMIAIFANNSIYGLKVPAKSLKAFNFYVKETARRNIDLTACITVIGFNYDFTYPVLTFDFGGWLAPEQITMIDKLKNSQEVHDIVGSGTSTPAPAQVAAPPVMDPFAQVATPAPVIPTPPPAPADPFAQVVEVAPAPAKAPKKAKDKVVDITPQVIETAPASDNDAALAALLNIKLV